MYAPGNCKTALSLTAFTTRIQRKGQLNLLPLQVHSRTNCPSQYSNHVRFSAARFDCLRSIFPICLGNYFARVSSRSCLLLQSHPFVCKPSKKHLAVYILTRPSG